MAAFDTALTPTASTPATTANSTLFTAAGDSSVLLDIVALTTSAQTVRAGIDPASTAAALHWKIYDQSVSSTSQLRGVGPWILQNGDKVVVASGSTGSVVTYSLTGLVTS